MVDSQREEHDEAADAAPHDLEELPAFSLHLLVPTLHPQILKSRSLLVYRIHGLLVHGHGHSVGTYHHLGWLRLLVLTTTHEQLGVRVVLGLV